MIEAIAIDIPEIAGQPAFGPPQSRFVRQAAVRERPIPSVLIFTAGRIDLGNPTLDGAVHRDEGAPTGKGSAMAGPVPIRP